MRTISPTHGSGPPKRFVPTMPGSEEQATRPAGIPGSANGELAAMIAAEVNEGGRPSPVPCDTPAGDTSWQEAHRFVSETSPMLETCPAPDRVIHLPLGARLPEAHSSTLMKTDGMELIRLVIPAGKEIPPHRAPGEIMVQCIEGHVAFHHAGAAIDLQAGDLLHLCPKESHSLKGVEDSSVLVTLLRLHAADLPETSSTPDGHLPVAG